MHEVFLDHSFGGPFWKDTIELRQFVEDILCKKYMHVWNSAHAEHRTALCNMHDFNWCPALKDLCGGHGSAPERVAVSSITHK